MGENARDYVIMVRVREGKDEHLACVGRVKIFERLIDISLAD